MNNQPELYRVQTTDGKSVVVRLSEAGDYYLDVTVTRMWQRASGQRQNYHDADLNLRTLTRLHLLTDDELQARDAELLERAADVCAEWLRQYSDVELKHIPARVHARDSVADIRDAIRAMKGQTHER